MTHWIRTIIKWSLSLGLLLMPFVQWQAQFSPYEIPKVWFVAGWLEFLLGLALLAQGVRSRKTTALVWLPLLLLITLTTSSILNQTLPSSIWGNPARLDGLFTLLHLVGLALIVTLVWQRSWELPVTRMAALGSIGIALWNIAGALVPMLVPLSARWSEGVAVGFGNPNILAGYLVVSLPFTYFLIATATRRYERLWWSLGILLQLSALYLTHSWGGLLGVLGFLLLLVVKQWKPKMFFLAFLLSVGVVFFYWRDYQSRLIPLQIVAESRERILMKGMLAIVERPILGWGWAQFSRAFTQIDWPQHYYVEAYVDRAHSSLIEIGVSGGLISMMLYILIILISLRVLLTTQGPFARAMSIVLILYVLHSQTNVTSVAEEVCMWFCVGIALNLLSSNSRGDNRSQTRRPA